MVRNYFLLLMCCLVGGLSVVSSQEVKIFRVSDFDLRGKVKSCLVSTDYGKEEYDFNADGLLTKSVTRYSDTDYSITYYKYKGNELLEKRFENYRDDVFDNSTSIANFYEIDSALNRKITEKIVSYDKEFLDLYEYHFDADNRLSKLIHSNNDGTDETIVKYGNDSIKVTKTYESNDDVLKIVQEKMLQINDTVSHKNIVTKKFIDGAPNTAIEEVFNESNKPLSITKFVYNDKTKKFVIQETKGNEYDAMGILAKTTTKSGGTLATKEYIYQFDEQGNWIKEIITPDNAYKTRKISYYEAVLVKEIPE